MSRYNPDLIKKISQKLNKAPTYIREQISRRALRHNILSEAELANWARSLGISADSYIRTLSPSVQSQILSTPSPVKNYFSKPSVLRIVQLGKKENEWYNLWWVQLLIAFFVVGILASTISQILGVYFTNSLGLTKP